MMEALRHTGFMSELESERAAARELRRDLAGTSAALAAERRKVAVLLAVMHPGVLGLIGNHHGQERLAEACAAIRYAND